MNSLTKKISIGVLSGFFAVGAIGAGVCVSASNVYASDSEISTHAGVFSTTVQFNVVEETIVPGGTITLEMEVSTSRADSAWSSADFFISPILEDGTSDVEVANCLSVVGTEREYLDLGALKNYPAYSSFCVNYLSNSEEVYFRIGIIGGRPIDELASTATTFKMTLQLNVSEGLKEVARIKEALEQGDSPEITFGLIQTELSNISYEGTNSGRDTIIGFGSNGLLISKDYTAYVANVGKILRLSEASSYQFLTLQESTIGNRTRHFRTTYSEMDWAHGEDDVELDRVVLGHVLQQTSINSFLSNFDQTQLNSIRLFGYEDEIIYDCGTIQAPFDTVADKGGIVAVGTGWRIELVVGENILDTVYVSVLGDVDGDGHLGSSDAACMYQVLEGIRTFDKTEYMLAALINNSGSFTTIDVSLLYTIMRGEANQEDFFNV